MCTFFTCPDTSTFETVIDNVVKEKPENADNAGNVDNVNNPYPVTVLPDMTNTNFNFIPNDETVFNNDDPSTETYESQDKVNGEYGVKYANLYKSFDVRYIKYKIWDTISKEEDNIDFFTLIDNVSQKLHQDVLAHMSPSSFFVCLLHLSNQKCKNIYIILVLSLDQINNENFIIRKN